MNTIQFCPQYIKNDTKNLNDNQTGITHFREKFDKKKN